MKLIVVFLFVIVFSINSFASPMPSDELDIENLPQAITGFIPSGYVPLKAVTGDVNLDRFKDVILVVKKADEEDLDSGEAMDGPKRPLLILIGQAGGIYKLATKNMNTVLCRRCGGVYGDPFEGITIKKGFFSVEHYGGSNWRWTKTITYKYSPTDKNWYLHRVDSSSFHTFEPDKVKETARTVKNFGKVRFDKFDIYKDRQ